MVGEVMSVCQNTRTPAVSERHPKQNQLRFDGDCHSKTPRAVSFRKFHPSGASKQGKYIYSLQQSSRTLSICKMKEKKPKQASTSDAGASNAPDDGIWKDPRFAHLVSDPRFKNIHKSTKSIKIDKRFKSMFNDDKFKVKYSVDKYGRRVNKTSADDLEKYYELSTDEDEDEEKRKEENEMLKESGDVHQVHESDEEIGEDIKAKLKDLDIDYARGELPLQSDSSSDEESSEDEDTPELFIEHVWGELDNDAPRTGESTRRLAACNMDWDRIRASDILVLCNSFLPPGGTILRVAIYPSEFGKERMAEEEVKGPLELTEQKVNSDFDVSDSDDGSSTSEREHDNDEGEDYHMEKLRQYQLNRLKYYYAVIECNSVGAADKLYAECDGLEYESTATKLDLRFIPDDMTFDDAPTDVCNELPDLAKYKPRLFTTTALQQAKVELTWDENDVDRKELNEKMMTGKLNEIADTDLRKYVAYSSEEESDADKEGEEKLADVESDSVDENPTVAANGKRNEKHDTLSKYKNLLKDITEKEEEKKKNRVEMEFSWGIGASASKFADKERNKSTSDLTPFEKIIEKKQEKKRARKEEIRKLKKAAKHDGSDAEDDEDDLPEGIDMNDPYFAEEFANGEFEAPKVSKNQKPNKKKGVNVDESGENDADAERKLALLLDDDDGKKHFSLKKIQDTENESTSKKKRKKRLNKKKVIDQKPVEDNFEINVNDKRFAAVFDSHLFNIDPTDSHFKKTKNMEKLIHEKLKRKPIETVTAPSSVKKAKRDIADKILIKNIKRKVHRNQE